MESLLRYALLIGTILLLTFLVCVDSEDASIYPQVDSDDVNSLVVVSDYIEEFGCNSLVYNRTSVIHDCLKRALHFFRKYLARLDKGKTFGVCRRFQDVLDCLEPVLQACPAFRQRYLTVLQPVVDFFKCACGQEGECMENLHCFEVEYRGILSRRCDDYFKFNVKQKTHRQCYFLQEKVDCKVALVTTACDAQTGEFAYNMYSFLAMHDPKTSACHLHYTPVQLYQGFHYDDNCPTYFLQDLATCSSNHLWNQMLPFDEENDLVAKGNKRAVQHACRSYRSYRKCIRHPRKACKLGTKEIFNYGTNLRKYALKMDYICQRSIKSDYLTSLSCYQDVLMNKTLNQCDYIYKDLKPWLDSVTAFQFYCKDNSEEALTMKSELNQLHACYEDIFRLRCGDVAGSTIGKLIELAFQDPAYLRYSYHPDCHLHRKSGRLKKSSPEIPADEYYRANNTISSSGLQLRTLHSRTFKIVITIGIWISVSWI